MKRSFSLGRACLVVSFVCSPALSLQGQDATDVEKRLSESAAFLSADSREGRGVGTKGLDEAADYLAAEFTKLGLKTDLFEGTPFQKFTINTATEMGPREKNTLVLVGPPATGMKEPTRHVLALEKSFTPLAAGGPGDVNATLVFAGYGITDPKNKYDDYAGLNVKDRVVVVIRKEPQQADPKSVFNGDKPSEHATFMRKIANASEHGAAGLIFVNDDFELRKKARADREAWRKELAKIAELQAKLPEEGSPEFAKASEEIDRLAESVAARAKRLKDGYDEILPFAGAGEAAGKRQMPVWFCLRSTIDSLLTQNGGKSLADREAEIDRNLQPQSQELADWKCEGKSAIETKQAEVKNVIAVLEGEGPLADETIVIGAHYDHVGLGGPGSLAPWTTAVHNGADDNASGTAALLETARRIATSAKKPRRRIAFMAFTAEERGLLGSAHYCRNPRFALEKTIAMLNMDMVGRLKDEKLIVYGTGTAAEFDSLVNELGAKGKFQITKHEGGFGPSDHASFYAKKIPVIHLFTGNHEDYHRPSDDVEKLNIEGIRRVADFTVEFAQRIDASEARPAYREITKIEHIGDGGNRPYFGSIPDYSRDDVPGLALMGVVENGPAAQGGLKGGDVIIGLGESKITGIEDFDGALRKFQPGDTVKVKVKRGEETLELTVKLGKRPG